MRKSCGFAALLAFTLALAGVAPGCGADNGLTMGRVHGTVTFEGDPIPSGQVLFVPDDTKGNVGVPSMGRINADGSYELSTQDPGDGAIVGFHKVGLRGTEPVEGEGGAAAEPPKTGKDLFAARAKAIRKANRQRPKPTGENVTKVIGGKSYRMTLPEKVGNPDQSGISVQVQSGSNRINFAVRKDGTVKVE